MATPRDPGRRAPGRRPSWSCSGWRIGWHFLYEGLVKLLSPGLDLGALPRRVALAPLGRLPLDRRPTRRSSGSWTC